MTMPDANGKPLLETRTEGPVAVLAVATDSIADADTMQRLGHDLRQAILSAGASAYVLDLSAVRFLTSGALGLIINIHAHLKAAGDAFALAGLTGEVADIITTMRLGEVIPIYPLVDGAVENLTKR
jgi:anti-anti-sigma factor